MRTLALGAVLAAALCGCGVELAPPESSEGSGTTASPPAAQESVPMLAPTEAELIREREDSIAEARLYHERQASMESHASCMAKAQQVDPGHRAVIEAACNRRRDAAPPR